GDAFLHDLSHAFVRRDRPRDFDRSFRHAGAAFERLRRNFGPDDEAAWGRLSRGDAEGKGVRGEYRIRPHGTDPVPTARGDENRSAERTQEAAAVDRDEIVYVEA